MIETTKKGGLTKKKRALHQTHDLGAFPGTRRTLHSADLQNPREFYVRFVGEFSAFLACTIRCRRMVVTLSTRFDTHEQPAGSKKSNENESLSCHTVEQTTLSLSMREALEVRVSSFPKVERTHLSFDSTHSCIASNLRGGRLK